MEQQFTDAELTNLRTACLTSSMRTSPGWAPTLDALAERLDRMREALDDYPEGRKD